MPSNGASLRACLDHWHCDPTLAAHACHVDRSVPCPTCGESTGSGPLCCGCSRQLTDTEVAACTPGHDEYCASCAAGALTKAWRRLADYYKKLAADREDEGTSVQLACLVLAEHCVHEWSTDSGGPTPEMVALAENTAGEYLDEMLVKALEAVRSQPHRASERKTP